MVRESLHNHEAEHGWSGKSAQRGWSIKSVQDMLLCEKCVIACAQGRAHCNISMKTMVQSPTKPTNRLKQLSQHTRTELRAVELKEKGGVFLDVLPEPTIPEVIPHDLSPYIIHGLIDPWPP